LVGHVSRPSPFELCFVGLNYDRNVIKLLE
jgi:hypothetical protein